MEVAFAVRATDGWPTERTRDAWQEWLTRAGHSCLQVDEAGCEVLVPRPAKELEDRRRQRSHELAGGWFFGAELVRVH